MCCCRTEFRTTWRIQIDVGKHDADSVKTQTNQNVDEGWTAPVGLQERASSHHWGNTRMAWSYRGVCLAIEPRAAEHHPAEQRDRDHNEDDGLHVVVPA